MLALAAACGRVGFAPVSDVSVDDAALDDAGIDALDAYVPLGPFGAPTVIAALSDPMQDDDPCVSGDGLELIFASLRGGNEDLWVSTRPTRQSPWSTPVLIAELNTTLIEKGAALSGDGLRLWFARESEIWTATRTARGAPWMNVAAVSELNSPAADGTPAVCNGGQTIFFRSDRASSGVDDIWQASRPDTASMWSSIARNGELSSSADDSGPWLSHDCTRICFDSDRMTGSTELWFSERVGGVFVPPTPMGIEGSDASLTTDERYIVFSENVGADAGEIFEASR